MELNRQVNKGVILAAGDGERLGSLTTTCPKVLLPIRGKPLISYPIEALAEAGISEIAIVVGCINDIGKDLIYWDAIDTGVFLLTGNFFQALGELVPKLGIDIEISDVIRFLVSRGHRFDTYDVSGRFWADVDTEEDLKRVTK